MGCHSGKVAAPNAPANPATVEGTLLAPEIAPEKEPSTPEKEAAEKKVEETAKAVVSMMVVDCGKLYSTHEGLARALDVYHRGWVPAFNDVKNGDTGEFLGEVASPHPAVALRLHRNGAVVCMGKQGVEAAGLNGVWNGGEIHGDKLTWSDGTVTELRIDGMTRIFSVTFDGNPYTGELHVDDTIHWSDGDVWNRHLGEKEVQPEASLPALPAACHAAATGSSQDVPLLEAPATAQDSRLSPVPEEPDSTAVSRNESSHDNRQFSPSPAPMQEVETEPLSSQRALFAMTAKMQEASGCASGSEKKGRRERTMCCC